MSSASWKKPCSAHLLPSGSSYRAYRLDQEMRGVPSVPSPILKQAPCDPSRRSKLYSFPGSSGSDTVTVL